MVRSLACLLCVVPVGNDLFDVCLGVFHLIYCDYMLTFACFGLFWCVFLFDFCMLYGRNLCFLLLFCFFANILRELFLSTKTYMVIVCCCLLDILFI